MGEASEDAANLLERLAAAVVDAQPGGEGIAEVARALEAARAGGALRGTLADEAEHLQRELRGGLVAEALAVLEQLVIEAQQGHVTAAVPATGAAAAARDAETVELIRDFLEESFEALARADEMLLAVEREGDEPERTHALFRVFHTIKGVAGFLDLPEVVRLAHATEAVLDAARDGRLPLRGDAFEGVFDATAAMRRLLETLRTAVDGGRALERDAEVAALAARLEGVRAAAGVAPRAVAAAPISAPTPTPPSMAPPSPIMAQRELSPSPPAARGESAPECPDEPAGEGEPRQPSTSAPPATPAPTTAPAPTAAPAAPPPPPPATPTATPAQRAAPAALRETVKVDLERVDSIVEMIGELIVVESMIVHAPEVAQLGRKFRNDLNQLAKISRDLQGVAMRMRMVPVRAVFQKMARLARDLGRRTGKDVVLETAGEDTEIDRSMVERLEDPLVHLVRNALDHGVEPGEERRRAGKPPRATLRLTACHEAGSVVVALSDDGRGLQRERIVARARERGLVDGARELSDAEVHELLFLPGFSTAERVTEISGRGVGMDVVKRNVEAIRGRVAVSSAAGEGTTFRLVLPLTLAVIDGMLVTCGAERYIVPSLSIVEALRPPAGMVSAIAGRGELANVRGEIMPLLRLRRVLEISGEAPPLSEGRLVVVEGLGRKIALAVDDVVTQQQVVIKPVGGGIGNTDLYSGAAVLSDGRVGLILNVDRLAARASRASRARAVAE